MFLIKGEVALGFTNLSIRPEYRSFEHNIINEFYVPVLKKSVLYKRSVGYFSSSILIEITKGLKGLVENNGKIQIIASPNLTKDDIKAIESGYKTREEVITDSILRNMDFDNFGNFEKKRLNILSYLIAQGILDIKIAFIETDNKIGIFHEKMGIVKDNKNNKIVFSGSMNETKTAVSYNYESFDVFCSWKGEEERIESKIEAFNRLWNNEMQQVRTIEFPEIAREKFEKYQMEEPDFDVDEKEGLILEPQKSYEINYEGPKLPSTITLRKYQEEAINNWRKNEYRGIFDMATGTGKTITGLAAATRLFDNNKRRLAIVIVCPYQHLVEQWVEDIELFDMQPIIGYSSSKQRNWEKNLKTKIEAYNFEIIDYFCFVTTNSSFSLNRIQNQLQDIQGELLLIVDEAHNFGARYLSKKLLKNANYRLALSATIERHNDEEGTELLYGYFGEKSIEYTLEDAIKNDMLTPYEYYPIPVSLTENELEKYKHLTYEISRRMGKDKNGNRTFKESAKRFMIERARVIAGAENKLKALKSEIEKIKDQENILVYCGATTINDHGYSEGNPEDSEMRQIDAVTKILGKELGMHVGHFTSKEDSKEREELTRRFANNEYLQALIAIRCLDEGVNIPSVETAFILASSTNPKEYIQRRGRVLRKHKNKTKAVIYDFITLPVPSEELEYLTEDEIKSYRGLIKREVERMKDFAQIALNSSVADFIIYDLESLFRLNEKGVNIHE